MNATSPPGSKFIQEEITSLATGRGNEDDGENDDDVTLVALL